MNKLRNNTLRRNTIQQRHRQQQRHQQPQQRQPQQPLRQNVMTINRDPNKKLTKINGKSKKKKKSTLTARRTPTEDNLSMVNTIERLQSEIGEFGEDKDVQDKQDEDEQPTIMLEDNSSSGSGSASGSGQDEEVGDVGEIGDHSSSYKWVPVVIEHENLSTSSTKDDKVMEANIKKKKSVDNNMMFTKESNRTADEKGVDVIDNQDIEDSIQMEKDDEEEEETAAGGDDESEEQKTISALFKLHDNQQNDDEVSKEKSEVIKNMSNDSNEEFDSTQKVVMFQGKQRKHGDINPSVVKEALKIFSSKNKQSLVKKQEESPASTPNNNNENTLSNVVLSIPSDHLKNLTGEKTSSLNQAKNEGKTIILAVPVKLSDKDMVEKQVEAIKEKLLSIGNYGQQQKNEDEKVISSSITTSKDINNMETTKDENKQSTSFTLPGKNIPTEEQHLQDIARNPISSVSGSIQPVLDELKGEGGSLNEPEKQNKGFLEAIAKLKSEKEAIENKIKPLSSSIQLNTEHEDNSDESKLAPVPQLVPQPQQKQQQQQQIQSNNNNTTIKATDEDKKPSYIQQIQEQQKQQQNPSLQSVPKVAFEQTKITTHNFPQQQQLQNKPKTATAQDVVGNKANNLSELVEEDDEAEEEEVKGNETLQNALPTTAATTTQQLNDPASQQQQDSSHFKSNPFNPSRIPMSFHASSNKPQDRHRQLYQHEDDGTWCKASCKSLCAPDCRFECCRAADRKNKIKKIKKAEEKKVKNSKKSSKKSRKLSSTAKSKKRIEMKVKSINERINKLIAEKLQSSTNDNNNDRDTTTSSSSSLFQNLPLLPKFNKKINYDSTKGHKFLKETQEKLHSLIEMLSKSSNQLTTAATASHMSASKKSLTCDVRCKVVCLPSCRFDCCKHDDEKR